MKRKCPHDRPLFHPGVTVAAIGAAVLGRLVYLGVWDREVSAMEDPGLREPALDLGSHGTRLRSLLLVVLLGALAAVTMKCWRRRGSAPGSTDP
jgi:hypothetical protein